MERGVLTGPSVGLGRAPTHSHESPLQLGVTRGQLVLSCWPSARSSMNAGWSVGHGDGWAGVIHWWEAKWCRPTIL